MAFENLYLNIYPTGGQPYAVRLADYEKTALNIGRQKGNHIIIDTQGVEDFHGWLVWENGQVFIVDNSSSGGIYENGIQVEGRQVFRFGDVVQLGQPAAVAFTLGLAEWQVVEPAMAQRSGASKATIKSIKAPILIYLGLLILCTVVMFVN